ncbi:NUDIX hydrolase [Paracoccus spongiarum]|uniref:NUDIX hydrolase n=1 Tax=Paracoccus spongiarum TaxID=3064387 RepID=A0ABT9JF07_9RHOB|nr:NUDIX hydrolase [Paracoccus sp. 2205BS29-5]MDP5308329.1 NUDIX hydrolase [Paracoccus sp. 2205BS29-5]
MIPRFGPAPRPGQSYRLRPGAYAVLLRGGQVLLTHQDGPEPEYQLPGGGIDAGEGAVAALHREVREETGYRIGALRGLGAYRRFCFMPEYDLMAEKLCGVWLGRPIRRDGPPTEPGHRAVWMAPAAALACLADPGARFWMARALRLRSVL